VVFISPHLLSPLASPIGPRRFDSLITLVSPSRGKEGKGNAEPNTRRVAPTGAFVSGFSTISTAGVVRCGVAVSGVLRHPISPTRAALAVD
jgi:hypothetical protein